MWSRESLATICLRHSDFPKRSSCYGVLVLGQYADALIVENTDAKNQLEIA